MTLPAWFDRVLLQEDGWIQLAAFAGAVLTAFLLRLGLSLWLRHLRIRKPSWTSVLNGAIFALPVLTPLLALLFVAIANAVLESQQLPINAFLVLNQLLLGWLFVEAILRFVRSLGMKLFLLLLTASLFSLDALDLLHPTLTYTQKLTFSLGKVKVTLYSVLSAIVALTVLLWLARGIRNGMERVLTHFTMRSSTRQLLLKTLSVILYCVVGLIALSLLGVDITALAVFSGALGVGLGFGLQKIASNFISGIILLMEKSIEIGDSVEFADGLTGTVQQTGARCTLMDLGDGRMAMVPNEDFITKRVVSATLYDRRARAEMRLRVGYDADLELVRNTMLECARAHPKALKRPAPSCYIIATDQTALEWVLWVWIADKADKNDLVTDVMTTILKRFKSIGIQVPVPRYAFTLPQSAESPIQGED